MNPASWLPLAAGGEFTQPSLHILFTAFTYVFFTVASGPREDAFISHGMECESVSLFEWKCWRCAPVVFIGLLFPSAPALYRFGLKSLSWVA